MESNIYKKLFEVKRAGIKLQRDTTAFNYKYATLGQIQEKLSEEFEKQKLLVTHRIVNNEVVTTIHDVDTKDAIDSSIPMSEWTKPQDKGSEITYYRRYNLLSLLDLEVEDDDGKKAQESVKQDDNKTWFNDEAYDKISDLVDSGQSFTIQDVRKKYKVSKAYAEKLGKLGVK